MLPSQRWPSLPKIFLELPEHLEHPVFLSLCIIRAGQLSIFWAMKATRKDLAVLIPGRVELQHGWELLSISEQILRYLTGLQKQVTHRWTNGSGWELMGRDA